MFVSNSAALHASFAAYGDGFPVYRVPSVIRCTDGRLLAFAEGRQSTADEGDIRVVMKTSLNDGVTWGAETVLLAKPDVGQECGGWAISDPTPVVQSSTGRVWLMFDTWPGDLATYDLIDSEDRALTGVPYAIYSDNYGVTWRGAAGTPLTLPIDPTTDAVDLFGIKPAGFGRFSPGPSIGIEADDGNLYWACYGIGYSTPRDCVVKLDTSAGTWSCGALTALGVTAYEPTLIQLTDGRFMMNVRTSQTADKRRRVFLSSDYGATWDSNYLDEALVSGGCQGSIIRHGSRILFSNPANTRYSNAATLTQASPAASVAPFFSASAIAVYGTWDGATVTVTQGATVLATYTADQNLPELVTVDPEQDVTFTATGTGASTTLTVGIGDQWWGGRWSRIRPTVRASDDEGVTWANAYRVWHDIRSATTYITGAAIGTTVEWDDMAGYSQLVSLPGGVVGLAIEAAVPYSTLPGIAAYAAITFVRMSIPG